MNKLLHLSVKYTAMMAMCFSWFLASAQTSTVSGVVTSSADGLSIPGASIIIEGTTTGVVTDLDGNFSIEASGEDVLLISYIGYVTQKVAVSNRAVVDVVLAEDLVALDEVVVVGYGTQKKSHLTGSISKVSNEKLDQISVARVDDALIGQVSGVNIQATSAEAGAAPTIRIRGTGSITSNSGPAVVVDGVIVDSDFLGNLDMNDIESFEVLKDAASAAIYGSEGSNGVLIITTKSGQDGKTKFSYETNTGHKQAFKSEEYAKSVADWAAREMDAVGSLSETTQYAQMLVDVTGIDRDWQDVFFDGGVITSVKIF